MRTPKVLEDFEIPNLKNFTEYFIYVYNIIKKLYGLKDSGKK